MLKQLVLHQLYCRTLKWFQQTWPALARKAFSPILATALSILACLFPVQLNAGQDKITNDFNMVFIRVVPGTFIMGSPVTEADRDKDEIQHEVTITKAFYLQDSEVTQGQWQKVMGKRWFVRQKENSSLPVTRVSFHECMKFIEKLNAQGTHKYRLPSEAEWEYACRAGSKTAYAFGNTIDCTQAMFGNNEEKDSTCIPSFTAMGLSPGGPAPVKTFAPNAWGFYDMHGNVWEWCADLYGSYQAPPVSESFSVTSAESRVRRGGSFYKHVSSLRSANRTYAHPGAKFQTTGFRLVLEADE